ncbi:MULTISPECIES: Dps family protein [Psychrobacter]|uniref:DNA starvation/stationary phase protection protein n=1 Tax=Psychrobacter pocilloporae TaxID=1775882 RepID=A0ABT6IUB9_9GAMM|nr:Dps family protein [Psychrobacter pocilloporae]MDH4905421.1 DNA starvation/stationary phase protection protein [Psychrobacter pocilloporae]
MSNTNNATNQIGLEKADMSEVIAQLNKLLSTYHVFYLNVRGYHWNVKGEHFFTLHPKFEELYTSLQLQIDEIAERILTLGGTPLHAYSDFAQHTSISEDKNVKDGTSCVKGVLTGLQALIAEQRQVSSLAAESDDQGTADLVDEYVQEQEKLVWMYNAFLG